MLIFEYVDGLTVRGNVQPLTSGTLVSISNSTNVSTDTDHTLLIVILVAVVLLLGRGRLTNRSVSSPAVEGASEVAVSRGQEVA